MAHFSVHGLQEAKNENPNSSLIFQITIFSKTKKKKILSNILCGSAAQCSAPAPSVALTCEY